MWGFAVTSPGVVTLIVTIEVFKHTWKFKTEENLGQGALLSVMYTHSRVPWGQLRSVLLCSKNVSSYVDETNVHLIWILPGDLFLNQESYLQIFKLY